MLYIFAGLPGKGSGPGKYIHAGGLQYAIETVEELANLEHDPIIQYRRGGVFVNGTDELLYPVEYRINDALLQEGVSWDWFPGHWAFGNGGTCHKTLASLDYRTVVHGTDLTLNEFLDLHGPSRLANLELFRKHVRHESWQKYEYRWLPGTCPQENHVVHLTWLVTTQKLPEFAYERIRDLIEQRAESRDLGSFSQEPGKHFHTIRRYEGKAAVHAL